MNLNESVGECHRKFERKSREWSHAMQEPWRLRSVSGCLPIVYSSAHWTPRLEGISEGIEFLVCIVTSFSSIMPWPTYVRFRVSVTHINEKKKKERITSLVANLSEDTTRTSLLLYCSINTFDRYFVCIPIKIFPRNRRWNKLEKN